MPQMFPMSWLFFPLLFSLLLLFMFTLIFFLPPHPVQPHSFNASNNKHLWMW